MPFYLLGIGHNRPDARLRGRAREKEPAVGIRRLSADLEPDLGEVHWIVHEGLSAAVTRPAPTPPEPRAHAALLAAIHRTSDILPARFGTALADEDAVRTFLDRHYGSLMDTLTRLAGSGEIGLRIEGLKSDASSEAASATDQRGAESLPCQYLASRRQQYDFQDRLNAVAEKTVHIWLHALKDLYREYRQLSTKEPRAVRLTFLVERATWGVFARHCEVVRKGMPEVQCRRVGPWPPYSFV